MNFLRGRRESVDRLIGFDIDKRLEGGIRGNQHAVCESRDVVYIAAPARLRFQLDNNNLKEAGGKEAEDDKVMDMWTKISTYVALNCICIPSSILGIYCLRRRSS